MYLNIYIIINFLNSYFKILTNTYQKVPKKFQNIFVYILFTKKNEKNEKNEK